MWTSRSERGSALLAVLWMSAALAAIAFSVSASIRAETDHASTNADGLRAYYLSSGSVERGIQWMMWGPGYANPDGSNRFWEPNMPRMIMHYPSGDAVVEMIPEAAKLNINTANYDELYRVALVVSGNADRAAVIARGILDWRSPVGSNPLSEFAFGPAPTFPARHASFEEIEELLMVPGMTPELFYGNFVAQGRLSATGGLRDCLSVWGGEGPFDINTVSPALMESFGIPNAVIAGILQLRSIKPLKSVSEVGAGSLPKLGTGGNFIWTLRATARLRKPDGSSSEVVRSSSATVKLLDRRQYFMNPVQVLRYYDDAWSQFAVVPPLFAPFPPPLPPGVPVPGVPVQ
jgi:general secretion pathway protein K